MISPLLCIRSACEAIHQVIAKFLEEDMVRAQATESQLLAWKIEI